MKELSVTPITNSAQFFPKKGTLQFLQLAFQEGFSAIVQAMIGTAYDPALVYVLYGCTNSGTYPAYNITEGVVYYAGKIYYVDATTFSSPGVEVAVFKVIQTQYTTDADPVTLSDATIHNIHNILKMQIISGATGSEILDYSLLVRINFVIPAQLNLTGTGLSSIGGVYPNLVVNTPAPAAQDPVLVWLGRFTSNGATITKLFGSATVSSCTHPGTGNYNPVHNIGHTNYFVRGVAIGNHFYGLKSVDSITGTGFRVNFSDDDTGNDCDFELSIYTYTP